MQNELLILTLEAMVVYFLVLATHALRHRFGMALFYALIGGLTAVMSWVTDAGVQAQFLGITFMVGSTVFYTSLLLGVFVVYVFDGPRATRITIFTIVGVSIMVPVIALVLHLQMRIAGMDLLAYVPVPDLRVNTASVTATLLDLLFLGVVWEYFGKPQFHMRLCLRAFFTLLGVMWLDVLLFATGAFGETPDYLGIMAGTLLSRFIITVFACPFLWGYLRWQNNRHGKEIESRPVLAIFQEVAEVSYDLSLAKEEIILRQLAEEKLNAVIVELQQALAEVKILRGFLPICASCKKIKDDQGYWNQIEEYISSRTEAEFSHGICPDCARKLYPELDIYPAER